MTASESRALVHAGVLATGHVTLLCQRCKNLLLECPCDGPRGYVLLDLCPLCAAAVAEAKQLTVCCQWCLDDFEEQPCDASDHTIMFDLCPDHRQSVYDAYNDAHIIREDSSHL